MGDFPEGWVVCRSCHEVKPAREVMLDVCWECRKPDEMRSISSLLNQVAFRAPKPYKTKQRSQ